MVIPVTELAGVNRVFPWLRYLSPDQKAEFYVDFFDALEQALREKDWSVLEATIESWQATAEVLTDAELAAILTEAPSDDDLEDWDDVEASLFNTAP